MTKNRLLALLALLLLCCMLIGCQDPIVIPIPSYPCITDFSLEIQHNLPYLLQDIMGTIDQETKMIKLKAPVGTKVSDLVPSFGLGEGVDVRVGNISQTTGASIQDFSHQVVYSIFVNDEHVHDYSVEVHRDQTVLEINRTGSFSITLDFTPFPKDVYFILTNPETSIDLVPPTIDLGEGFSSRSGSMARALANEPDRFMPIMGKPEIDEFNKLLPSSFPNTFPTSRTLQKSPEEPVVYAVGSKKNFSDDSQGKIYIEATCMKAITDVRTLNGMKNLYLWVENKSLSPLGDRVHLVTQEMVDLLAEKFLRPGLKNDIYDWATAIFGAEWGPADSSNLIQNDSDIHILLKDIDDDNSVTGGVIGYFWSKDNYVKILPSPDFQGSNLGSNECLLFTLDSVLLATPDEGSEWDRDAYWPQVTISALTHEFQHMIHFYQKNVLKDVYSETWLNEMCSLVAEDFLADKLMVPGPRGIATGSYFEYSSDFSPITKGRIPLFNRYNNESINVWMYGDDVLRSYANSYAFGAYLARNYGGAPFFTEILQSEHGGYLALEEAAKCKDPSITFSDLLSNWGLAVILSDRKDTDPYLSYNNGSHFASFQNEIEYRLGSINLHNYAYKDLQGPSCVVEGAVGNGLKASNGFFHESQVSSRTYEFTIPEGYRMSLVIQ